MSISSKFDKSSVFDGSLPFNVKASFKAIFHYWEDLAKGDDPDRARFALNVLEKVSHAQEILEPFDDFSLLDKYEKEIAQLFAPVFPEPLKDNEIKAISLPFRHFFFNPTPRLRRILKATDTDYHLMVRDTDPDTMYIFACIFLLNVIYGANIEYKRPFYFEIPDAKNDIIRYYRAFFNGDFAEFHPTANAPKLNEEDINELRDNFDNIALWKEKIPQDSYVFEGFGLVTLFDVTPDEALSDMKNILLKGNVLNSQDHLQRLETDLKSYLNTSDIHLGLATYDARTRTVTKLGSGECMVFTGCEEDSAARADCFCEGSANQVFDQKKMLIMSDMDRFKELSTPLMDSMRQKNVRSFIICPLEYDKEIIGFLELTSKEPHVLNSVLANKLQEVTQLFTVAMQRSLEELETRKEAIVQEKFTSIHPSVSWRFFEVAENVINARQHGRPDPNEEVIFKNVVPIYGQFDIRGSSTARNVAIQADLVKQLSNAEQVMDTALGQMKWPIYDQLKHRICEYREQLESSINAGDEVKILDFLKSEIYPVFRHLSQTNTGLDAVVQSYMQSLDAELGVIYDKRKKYEDSVTMINEAIARLVDEEEARAQQMFPHYFEKYKTDGVEYNLYVGQSLLQNLTYDPVHLKNLRLWQLLMTYRVEQHLHDLRDRLPVRLEIASLILAHNAPLSIKFRQDEKKFDVDGAYNIRYEIVKKRIDKARIKGTTERLTQPGKLAIVYSHDDEVQEYDQYLHYLQSQGMLSGDIEHVDLEDLQGTAGLRALRTTIQYNGAPLDTSDLEKAIQEMKN